SVDGLQFRAVYRVLLGLDDGLDDTVEFLATGWTSHYAHERYALVYVVEQEGEWVLPGGLATPVHPTADGDWGSCEAKRDSEALDFAGLVFGRTEGLSDFGIRATFPADTYRVTGTEVFCTRGRRIPALVEELDRQLEDRFD